MKNLIIYSFLISILFVLNVSKSDAQSRTNFNLQRKVALNPESEKTEIKVLCKKELNLFDIAISGKIYKGNLKIEIYDPKGIKIDNFSIESHLKENTKGKSLGEWEANAVTGQINKSFQNPLSGNWMGARQISSCSKFY